MISRFDESRSIFQGAQLYEAVWGPNFEQSLVMMVVLGGESGVLGLPAADPVEYIVQSVITRRSEVAEYELRIANVS